MTDQCTHYGRHIQPPPPGDIPVNLKYVCLSCYSGFLTHEEALIHGKLHFIFALREPGLSDGSGSPAGSRDTVSIRCLRCDTPEVKSCRKVKVIYAWLSSPEGAGKTRILELLRSLLPTVEDYGDFASLPESLKGVFGSPKELTLEGVSERWKAGVFGRNVVMLVGAGISVIAGIPDFRSPDIGLYARAKAEYPELDRAEDLFNIHFFRRDPYPFYRFIKKFMANESEPAAVHLFAKALADRGWLRRIYTQNFDGLERSAGVPAELVVQVHGNLDSAMCGTCGLVFQGSFKSVVMDCDDVLDIHPLCTYCLSQSLPGGDPGLADVAGEGFGEQTNLRGYIKPAISFFGESVSAGSTVEADFAGADLLLVVGTSLSVTPVSRFPSLVNTHTPRVYVNKTLPSGPGSAVPGAPTAGFDFKSSVAYRDVFLQMSCEEAVARFSEALGFSARSEGVLALSDPRWGLRPFKMEDAEALVQVVASDEDRITHFIDVHVGDLNKAQLYIRSNSGGYDAGTSGPLSLGIFNNKYLQGEIRGSLRPDSGDLYIEYWVHRGAEGRGVVSEAVFVFMQTAAMYFGRKAVRMAHIVCHPDNKASQAVARRLGFKVTATGGRALGYGELGVSVMKRMRFYLPLQDGNPSSWEEGVKFNVNLSKNLWLAKTSGRVKTLNDQELRVIEDSVLSDGLRIGRSSHRRIHEICITPLVPTSEPVSLTCFPDGTVHMTCWRQDLVLVFKREDFTWVLTQIQGSVILVDEIFSFAHVRESGILSFKSSLIGGRHSRRLQGNQTREKQWKLKSSDWLVRESDSRFVVPSTNTTLQFERLMHVNCEHNSSYVKLHIKDEALDLESLVQAMRIAIKEVMKTDDVCAEITEVWMGEYSRTDFLRRMGFESMKGRSRRKSSVGAFRLNLEHKYWWLDAMRIQEDKTTRSRSVGRETLASFWKLHI